MKRAIACLLGGLTFVSISGPANAQPVIYKVDFLYEKIVDGTRPKQIVRISIRAASRQAADVMCASGMKMLKLGRNILAENPGALDLTGNWMAGGGECVTDAAGNVEMTVETSPGGNN